MRPRARRARRRPRNRRAATPSRRRPTVKPREPMPRPTDCATRSGRNRQHAATGRPRGSSRRRHARHRQHRRLHRRRPISPCRTRRFQVRSPRRLPPAATANAARGNPPDTSTAKPTASPAAPTKPESNPAAPEAGPSFSPALARAAIERLLGQYKAALERRNVDAFKALWPTMSRETEQNLRRAFGGYKALTLDMSNCSPAFTANGRLRDSHVPRAESDQSRGGRAERCHVRHAVHSPRRWAGLADRGLDENIGPVAIGRRAMATGPGVTCRTCSRGRGPA